MATHQEQLYRMAAGSNAGEKTILNITFLLIEGIKIHVVKCPPVGEGIIPVGWIEVSMILI